MERRTVANIDMAILQLIQAGDFALRLWLQGDTTTQRK
jgi:hypothetical protein